MMQAIAMVLAAMLGSLAVAVFLMWLVVRDGKKI